MDCSKIGERIKKYRKKQNMTQQMLGEEIDYSVQHISHIETGKTSLSLECLLDIANALHVTMDELVCGYASASSVILDREIKELLEDCTPQEKQILLDTMKSLKASLRKNPARDRK